MSKTTKRKHVTNEVLNDYVTPEGSQEIVKILAGKGNNLHEVQSPNGNSFLVSMPTKFRRNIWIKRGDYVIIEPIEEGDKVKAEIVNILYKEQIKFIKKEGLWPKEFDSNAQDNPVEEIRNDLQNLNSRNSSSESESDDELFVNTNHTQNYAYESSDSSSDSDDEDDNLEPVKSNPVSGV